MKELETLKELETKYAHFNLSDGMLIMTFKKGLTINLDIAKEVTRERMGFIGEQGTYPTMVFEKGINGFEKSARDFLSSDEGTRGIKAGALVLESSFSSLLGNFFLRVNKPKIPSKIFSNKDEALNWLKQFRG